jgi:hypothetical protein
MEFLKKNRLIIAASLLGAAVGFLYWRFVGCESGTCPIKSVWYLSTLFGGVIGGLAGSIIDDMLINYRKKKNQEQDATLK